MTLAYPSSRPFAWRPAAVALVLVVAAMGLGQIATTPNLPWYESLQKPWFTPPNWVFGPVWTALYVWMGYLFFRIARLPAWVKGRSAAIAAFVALLIVNVAWSFALFSAHNPAYGLTDIAAQAAMLVATVALFNRLDGFAAAGFLPVALWLAYAGALNFEIWRTN
jgi:tryptophan-rich sensory protein